MNRKEELRCRAFKKKYKQKEKYKMSSNQFLKTKLPGAIKRRCEYVSNTTPEEREVKIISRVGAVGAANQLGDPSNPRVRGGDRPPQRMGM